MSWNYRIVDQNFMPLEDLAQDYVEARVTCQQYYRASIVAVTKGPGFEKVEPVDELGIIVPKHVADDWS